MTTIFSTPLLRFFQVGQMAIAQFFGNRYYADDMRCVPCRICGIVSHDNHGRAASVRALVWFPNRLTPVVHVIETAHLHPSTNSIFYRAVAPRWFLARSPRFNQQPADVNVINEAFSVCRVLPDERYETLDAWLGAIDSFVDANQLQGFERADLDKLRLDVHVARLDALRDMNGQD